MNFPRRGAPHLLAGHGCEGVALGDAVDGQEDDVGAVGAQQDGADARAEQLAAVEVQRQVAERHAEGERRQAEQNQTLRMSKVTYK